MVRVDIPLAHLQQGRLKEFSKGNKELKLWGNPFLSKALGSVKLFELWMCSTCDKPSRPN